MAMVEGPLACWVFRWCWDLLMLTADAVLQGHRTLEAQVQNQQTAQLILAGNADRNCGFFGG